MLVTLPAQAGRIASVEGPVLLSTPGEPLRQPVHLHSVGAVARLICRSTRAPTATWDGLAGAPEQQQGYLLGTFFADCTGLCVDAGPCSPRFPVPKKKGLVHAALPKQP